MRYKPRAYRTRKGLVIVELPFTPEEWEKIAERAGDAALLLPEELVAIAARKSLHEFGVPR